MLNVRFDSRVQIHLCHSIPPQNLKKNLTQTLSKASKNSKSWNFTAILVRCFREIKIIQIDCLLLLVQVDLFLDLSKVHSSEVSFVFCFEKHDEAISIVINMILAVRPNARIKNTKTTLTNPKDFAVFPCIKEKIMDLKFE